ncbi:UNVERIFIED_CONTAM: RNA recognition motif-containing protein [Hammondia hammondi]|eukprot:XP_008882578.1 RNA recognition motif-containing protein [Hammondia hammondi]
MDPEHDRGRQRLSLLVRNLSFRSSPDEVRAAFEEFGPIRDVYLPLDYHTGEPRGFGFVEFESSKDAYDAMHQLHNTLLNGSTIHVTIAKKGRSDPMQMLRVTLAPRHFVEHVPYFSSDAESFEQILIGTDEDEETHAGSGTHPDLPHTAPGAPRAEAIVRRVIGMQYLVEDADRGAGHAAAGIAADHVQVAGAERRPIVRAGAPFPGAEAGRASKVEQGGSHSKAVNIVTVIRRVVAGSPVQSLCSMPATVGTEQAETEKISKEAFGLEQARQMTWGTGIGVGL